MMDIGDPEALAGHPVVGASWEGMVVEQIAMLLGNTPMYFWGTHSGAELDLFFTTNGRNVGIEIKRADAPRLTSSMRNALVDLDLDQLWVVYPGDTRYAVDERVEVLPLAQLGRVLDKAP